MTLDIRIRETILDINPEPSATISDHFTPVATLDSVIVPVIRGTSPSAPPADPVLLAELERRYL